MKTLSRRTVSSIPPAPPARDRSPRLEPSAPSHFDDELAAMALRPPPLPSIPAMGRSRLEPAQARVEGDDAHSHPPAAVPPRDAAEHHGAGQVRWLLAAFTLGVAATLGVNLWSDAMEPAAHAEATLPWHGSEHAGAAAVGAISQPPNAPLGAFEAGEPATPADEPSSIITLPDVLIFATPAEQGDGPQIEPRPIAEKRRVALAPSGEAAPILTEPRKATDVGSGWGDEKELTSGATSENLSEQTEIPSAPLGAFDEKAARAAVGGAVAQAAACGDGSAKGSAKVAVTFAPSGRATQALLLSGPSLIGTSVGSCVAQTMRNLSVPPFEGAPVTVTKTIRIR